MWIFGNLTWISPFLVENFNPFVLEAQKELSVQIWFCKNPRVKFSQFHIRFCKIHLDFSHFGLPITLTFRDKNSQTKLRASTESKPNSLSERKLHNSKSSTTGSITVCSRIVYKSFNVTTQSKVLPVMILKRHC